MIELSENKFEEEYYFTITPSKNEYYNFGIHTINYVDNKIVVDGLVRRFLPLAKLENICQNTNKLKTISYSFNL